MNEGEKSEILDDLGVALVRSGLVDLSLDLEEFDDLKSDLRWCEISFCLRRRKDLPDQFDVFCQEDPDWDSAQDALEQ